MEFESSRAHEKSVAAASSRSAIIVGMDESDVRLTKRLREDAARNEAARIEMFTMDAHRSLGENLEQADALIKAAYELAEGRAAATR